MPHRNSRKGISNKKIGKEYPAGTVGKEYITGILGNEYII